MSLLLCLNRPNVIGILHCKKVEKLACLSEDQLFGVDAIELRLDLLDGFPPCLRGIANARRPLIVTARHPREGGNRDLTMGKYVLCSFCRLGTTILGRAISYPADS
ncbi:MAG: hypothetical protein JMM75_00520 [Candidatus Xiphinematobacter sp.]|nr:MAG: hypothetical protein JMM75_00520 [Candidatus Xiphinematobacter sp.]